MVLVVSRNAVLTAWRGEWDAANHGRVGWTVVIVRERDNDRASSQHFWGRTARAWYDSTTASTERSRVIRMTSRIRHTGPERV